MHTGQPWTKSDHLLARGTGDTLRTARWRRCRTLDPLIHVVDLHYMSARFQLKEPGLLRGIVLNLEESNYLLHVLKTTSKHKIYTTLKAIRSSSSSSSPISRLGSGSRPYRSPCLLSPKAIFSIRPWLNNDLPANIGDDIRQIKAD